MLNYINSNTNSYQINLIPRKYKICQLLNNSIKHVIRHNSTTFMLYCMEVCVYLTTLLADSNNIHKIYNLQLNLN